jgi:CHAT domain-containing protein/tetratricopeptide (TPR) repeat protein
MRVCAAALLVSMGVGAQSEVERPLAINSPVDRDIAAGQTHEYRVDAPVGAFLRVEIRGEGAVDLTARVTAPSGGALLETENFERSEHFAFEWIALTAGSYRIEIRRQEGHRAEAYRLTLAEVRPAREDDHRRIEAEAASAKGHRLRRQGTAESLRSSVTAFEDAIAQWRALGDRKQLASALHALGLVYRNLGRVREAIAALTEAASLQVGDVRRRAATLNGLGSAYLVSGDPQRALAMFEEALDGERRTQDVRNEAKTLNNMGTVLMDLGQMHRAIAAYQEALAKADPQEVAPRATRMSNLGAAYGNIGDVPKAKEYLTRALDLRRSIGDKRGQAATLYVLGNVSQEIGELQQALEYLGQSLELRRATGDRPGEASSLQGLGSCYAKLGEPQVALEYFSQSRKIRREIGNREEEADSLMHISAIHGQLRQRSLAIEYGVEALRLTQEVGNPRVEGEAFASLGELYLDFGEPVKALDHFERAIPLSRRSSEVTAEAKATGGIGSAQIDLGHAAEAIDALRRALVLASRTGNKLEEIEFEYRLGRAHAQLGALAEARVALERAVAAADGVRSRVAGADFRAHYFATVRRTHELLIDTLMRLDSAEPGKGFRGKAFEVAERSRARGLLELLTESRADLRESIESPLMDQERTLEAALAAKTDYAMRIAKLTPGEVELAAAQRELDSLTIAFREVEAEIRAKSPKYAALTQPSTLTVDDIQRSLLDSDTVLLEYALGQERSYVWSITQDTFEARVLPARSVIEAAVRRGYRQLSEHDPGNVGSSERSLIELGALLIGTLGNAVAARRIVVVADGSLEYLPFGVLPARLGVPLLLEHEIVTLPSASTLAELRREGAQHRAATKIAAVIADPVFDKADPRVRYKASLGAGALDSDRPTSTTVDIRRSAMEAGIGRLERLQFSRREADVIRELLPASERFSALDFDASRETLLSSALGDYRMVHIATHGLINSRHPELSGLVLSLVDRQGRTQNGFVQGYELYKLRLGADLVVLSACQTALGEQIRGEGLISLTRPFMYAGVPRIVASLWQVPDRATAELMTRFYRGVIGNRLSPAAALREAQLGLRKIRRWSHPYFWAGFTLQGDWR